MHVWIRWPRNKNISAKARRHQSTKWQALWMLTAGLQRRRDGERVVGWCDAIPHWADALKHRAGLGMGVISDHRGQGIGKQLLRACLEKAMTKGIRRIDLEVRADNEIAIALYEKFGFAHEGRKSLGLCHKGIYYEAIQMGLVFPDVP